MYSFFSLLRKQVRKMRKTYAASDHPNIDGDPKMAFSETALHMSGKSTTR